MAKQFWRASTVIYHKLVRHSLSEHGVLGIFVDLRLVLDVLGAISVPDAPKGEKMPTSDLPTPYAPQTIECSFNICSAHPETPCCSSRCGDIVNSEPSPNCPQDTFRAPLQNNLLKERWASARANCRHVLQAVCPRHEPNCPKTGQVHNPKKNERCCFLLRAVFSGAKYHT